MVVYDVTHLGGLVTFLVGGDLAFRKGEKT